MLAFFVYLFAVYGFCNAITVLKFGKWLRDMTLGTPIVGALLRCPACLSFWIGTLVSWQVMSPSQPFCNAPWKSILLDGLAASAFSYFAHVIMEKTGHGLDI